MKVKWLLAVATSILTYVGGSAVLPAQTQAYSLSDSNVEQVAFGGVDCGCDNGKDACGCDTCGTGYDECEPWRLFPEGPGGVTLTGWIAAGATANADTPASRYNGPVTFNDRDEVQLNQLYAIIGKGVDTSCQCWDIGGQVDLLYGTDYIFTQATGLETNRDGSPKWNSNQHYGLAMPQAYVEVAYNNLSVKIGHFYTVIGNEVVTAPDNFFYSHAYTMQYGEPFTHTGALATYNYSDRVDILAGIHNGWDVFDTTTERAGFLGGFTWESWDERASLAVMFTSGEERNAMNVFTNRTMYSIVGSYAISDSLEYVIQHDNAWQEAFFGPNVDAEWYGINQYLFYTINDCWKAGARFEWFRDDDGVRVAGVRPGNPNDGPYIGDFYEVSLGLNWTPTSNLIVRPEARWDWFDGAGLPFDDGTEDDQFTAAMDVILLY